MILALATAALASCGGEPPKPAEAPSAAATSAPTADASPQAPSALWTSLVGEERSETPDACDDVRARLDGDKACKGALCSFGRDLAKEWRARCAKDRAKQADAIASLETALAAKASEAPSACAKDLRSIVDKGCGRDQTCEVTAQRWAARCGKSEAGGIAVAVLERAVEKRRGSHLALDLRSCADLEADVTKGVHCADHDACIKAAHDVEARRVRCSDGVIPTAARAAQELGILAIAGFPTVPTVVQPNPPKLTPKDLPVVLADGWGAIVSVCDKPAVDLAHYLDARASCEKGKLKYVRVFTTKAHDVDVRVGELEFPDDETFSRRFPSIRAQGEVDAADKAAIEDLRKQLAEIAPLASDPAKAPEAGQRLAALVIAHAATIRRSPEARALLKQHDEALAPALAAVAEAKAHVLEGKPAPSVVAGLAGRGLHHAFADLNEEGRVELFAIGRAWDLPTEELMPTAHAAYAKALAPVLEYAHKHKLSVKDELQVKRAALDAASTCADSVKRARVAEQSLRVCAFAIEPCAPDKLSQLVTALDEADLEVQNDNRKITVGETTLSGAARTAVDKAAKKSGCVAPWW